MSITEYAVRNTGGLAQHGTFPDGVSTSIYVAGNKDISLNLRPTDVKGYRQNGNDLYVQLENGKTLILEGYFDESVTGDKSLFLSESGRLVEVSLADGSGDTLVASYEALDVGGKWSAYDELVFLDVELIEPVVAPLIAPLIGGLGSTAAIGAAALVGGAAVIGGGGGTAVAAIVPTVDDADVARIIGGTGPDTVTVTGTGEPGASVDVTIGTQTQTVIIDTDGKWSAVFDPATLPVDGVYATAVLVTALDGTTTTLDGPSVDIDTTPPDIAVDAGTVSVGDSLNAEGHSKGATISGKGEVGASVTVEIDGASHSTTVADDGTWTVTFDSSEVKTGEFTTSVSITSTDARGNAVMITDSLLVDTVPPPATIDTVATDDVINAGEAAGGVTITGTSEAGATLVVEFQGVSKTVTVDANGVWTASYAAADVKAGTYDSAVSVTATDAMGNSFSTSQSVHVDTTTSVGLDATQAGDNVISAAEAQAGVTLTGTAEAGAQVQVTMQGVTHTVTADASGNWSSLFNASEIPAGEYDAAVSVVATDAAGNSETTSGTVRVDTVATVALDATQAGDNLVNAAEAQAGVNLTGTAEAGSQVQVTMQGVTHTVTANAAGVWSAAFSSAEIPAGEYAAAVSVTSTDPAGNTATTSGTVQVDTTTSVALDGTQAGDNVINNAEAQAGVTLTGTAEAGAQVQVTMQGVTHTVTADASGNWSSLFNASEIPGGEYDAAVTVVATDAAGNSDTTSGMVRVDTTTSVTVAPGLAGGDNIVNAAEAAAGITLNGTAEAGAQVQVSIAGVTRAATVDAAGNWTASFEAGALPNGEFDTTATINSTDAAGNTATTSTALRIDTVAGDVQLSASPIEIDDVINAVERADGVTISGIATPGLTVTVGLGAASHQVVAGPNGAFSSVFAASEIPTGTTTLPITASITDAAGNTKSVSDTVGLDTQVDNNTANTINVEGDGIVNFVERSDGVTLTGTTEPGSTVSVQLGSATHMAVVDAAGNWTVDFSASDIPLGEYDTEIVATATDPAGNVDTVRDTIRVDTLVSNLGADPNQTADDIVNAQELTSGVTLTGSTEPGSSISVELQGVTHAATVDASGNWTVSYTPTELPPGTYTATANVTATDVAGNVESFSESFKVDTEINTPNVDAVTFIGADVGRISTEGTFDNFSVNTLDSSGQIGSPSYTQASNPTFGTEFTFNTPVSDGTHLVVNAVDDAGNRSSTLLVLEDNATNAGIVDNAGLAQFDIHALNLDYAVDTNLTLTETQIQQLSGGSDTLTIHGGADDTINVAGATLTADTRVIEGQTYEVYTLGDSGTTLVIEQDINVII